MNWPWMKADSAETDDVVDTAKAANVAARRQAQRTDDRLDKLELDVGELQKASPVLDLFIEVRA